MMLTRALDWLVSVVSPQAGYRRAMFREALARNRRSEYAAAKTTRLTGTWSPLDASVKTVIGNSLKPVRARVRQLIRDFPYLARAVKVSVDYTVGEGIRFQSRVKNIIARAYPSSSLAYAMFDHKRSVTPEMLLKVKTLEG